jgi:serine/threonine protein phosphatase PrpC
MQNESVISKPLIDWGVASRALPGEVVCGDRHLIKPIPDGVLLAVVDGLGHGDEATAAAQTALALLEEHREEPLEALVTRCHDALTKTRGAVMTVATLNSFEDKLTWLGVGNVEAVLLRAGDQTKAAECVPLDKTEAARSERVVLRGGIVGYRLPELHTSTRPIQPGDLLVFVTDGISSGFPQDLSPGHPPQQLADLILERHFKGTDDALVLVVRYVGPKHE